MKRVKVGLNGFGRIGRAFARIALKQDQFDIVAINTRRTKPDMLAYLLQHDSIYRQYPKSVKAESDRLLVENKSIICSQISEPKQIPWSDYMVDIVIDATGVFTTQTELQAHLQGSVKKVVLTSPAKDEVTHVVMGVNNQELDWQNLSIMSNASCTTNCAAPMFKIIDQTWGVVAGFLTTIHAYTSSQSLVDEAQKKYTRSRAAAINMIPTTTGAAIAVTKVLPSLKDKIDGLAIRVPVALGSFTDLSVWVNQDTTIEEINQTFEQAVSSNIKGILAYETKPLVSSDYIGNPYSVTFDANYTQVKQKKLIKVTGWYDNEWGYSQRLVDLVKLLSNYC